MRFLIAAAAFMAGLHGVAQAQSARFLSMENTFEQRLAALGPELEGLSQSEIYERAAPVAESVFGADWRVVAAEARRALRALPTYDLAPYADAEAQLPFSDLEVPTLAPMTAALRSRGQMAALRFYDPRHVGLSTALFAVSMVDAEALTRERIYVSGMFANRTFRSRLGGETVLVTRVSDRVVVTPYVIDEAGMLKPELARVRVYRRL